jgi:hypothetical protein
MKTRFRDMGSDGNATLILEYEDQTPVFYYRGFYDGKDHFTLYPRNAVVKGTRRDKVRVHIKQIERW